jgi:hypothetical protein
VFLDECVLNTPRHASISDIGVYGVETYNDSQNNRVDSAIGVSVDWYDEKR